MSIRLLSLFFSTLLLSLAFCPVGWAQFAVGNGTSNSTSSTTSGGIGSVNRMSNGYPIGTSASQPSGVIGPVWGTGGVPAGTNIVSPGLGQFGYFNNAGIGYYYANPQMAQYPVFPMPVSLGDGFYQFGGLSERLGYWRAPSGFYYPWCPTVYLPGVPYPPAPPIYAMDQGGISVAQPPVAIILEDMRQFIDDSKSRRQLDQSNYEHLASSLTALRAQSTEFASRNAGKLNTSDEAYMRRQLDLLSAEIARALNP